jgi:hypothetical protein
MVSDGMVAITNAPPVPQMFTPGFPHTFLPHPASFAAPQMYIITTPEGSYFTYGLPTTGIQGVQMPRPSSPPTVPNVGNTDDNSTKASEVPLVDSEAINLIPEDEVINEVNEEVVRNNTNSNNENDNQNYGQNNEPITESNSNEVNLSKNNENNDNNEFDYSIETIPNESNDTKTANTLSQQQISPLISSASSSSTTTSTNVCTSSKSWADLFKGSSSASIHSSHIQSSYSSNTSVFTGPLVPNNYNSSEIDNKLSACDVNNSESDAQIQSIPMRSDPFARKLSKRLRDISLKHSLPYLIPCGFVNRGNWCYINAVSVCI